MKKVLLTTLAALIGITTYAQKPKKTHNSEKFVQKVQFSMTPDLIGKWLPDDVALQYIADNGAKELGELKAEKEINAANIKKDVEEFTNKGIAYILDKSEVKVKQESPVKVADIILYCHAKENVFTITFTNCVQTNLSWYLGDGIVPEGSGFESAVSAKESKKNAKIGGVLGKMGALNAGMKDKENEANVQLAVMAMKQDSINALRPGYESNYETFLYDKSKNNVPMHGYYVLKDGSKVDAVILNQAPEFFVGDAAHGFSLAICGGAGSTPAVGFNDHHPNFEKYINKRDIKAFNVNGYLYQNLGFYGWAILLNEGAIHSYITVVKLTVEEKDSYQKFKQTQKLDGLSYGAPLMPISEKNLLKMMEDAPEIIQGYKDGKYNLESAEIEYNIWYDKTNPGKIDYIFGVDGKK